MRWNAAAMAGAGVLALGAAGCAFTPPEKAPEIAAPKTRPVRTVTNFSESLRCMDELFAQFGVRDIVVTSQGIPDATGEITAGTKEMMISAISRMSMKSKAFRFVDFDQSQFDINALQQLVGFTDTFLVPNYYLRGAISQFDENIVAENAGAGFSLPFVDAGISADQVVSLITVDLNVGDLLTRQIIPGTTSSNTIVVRRSGESYDAGGTIEKIELGLNFNLSFNRNEGMHQGVRNLVELSLIEALGKLAQVPYWRCLQIEQTNPAVMAQARDWFESMSEKERVLFVQRALAGAGYYSGPLDGILGSEVRDAIGAYQAANGLQANGRIDFDLYAALIAGDLALARRPDAGGALSALAPAAAPVARPLELELTTERGPRPSYRVGERLRVSLRSSRDAFAYCYYRDATGNVARVFPNRFQPNALVGANAIIEVPGPAAGFEIVFDQPGAQEELLCVAADLELGTQLPPALKVQDLAPLPVKSLDEVVEAFRKVGGNRVRFVQARVPITVGS